MKLSEALPAIQQQLRAYFRSLTKDPDRAEDLCQFALQKCCEHWKDKDLTTQIKLALTAGRNHYFSERKRERNQRRLLLSRTITPDTSSPEAQLEKSELYSGVRQAIQRLPAKLQGVVERLFFRGQSYEEAAAEMGKPVNTIKTWRRRALAVLRGFLHTLVVA